MIEFLPPRDDAFGERDVADFVGLDGDDDATWGDEAPRSRWLSALAVVGVTGLLAGGVVAAAPWDDPETATTPTPTTAAPTTTERPRPTTTVATEPTLPIGLPTTPAGWVPVEGSGFLVSYGSSYGDDGSFVPETDVVVYGSTADVARTDGRWIAIEANTQDMGPVRVRRGAVATTAGDRRVLVSTADDGVVVLDVDPYGNATANGLTISAFGVELAQLLAVAATVDLEWQGMTRVLDLEAVEAGGALDGLGLVADEEMAAWSAGFVAGTPKAWTNVVDDTGTRWWNVELVRPYDRPSRAAALIRYVPVAVDEQPLEIQQRLDELARLGWQVELRRSVTEPLLAARAPLPDGDELVVSTYGTVDDLLDVIGALRPATDAEWVDMLLALQNGRLDVPMSEARYESTTLGSGTNWSSDVNRAGSAPWQFGLSTMYSYAYEPFEPGVGPELIEYRSLEEAYLRATTTAPTEARFVVVSQESTEPNRSRLREIPGTGVFAAVIELDPELPYTVTWTDELGNPVDGPVDAAASTAASTAASGAVP